MIIRAIYFYEYWLLRVCVFAIVMTLVVVLFISNVIFILYNHILKDRIRNRFKKISSRNVNSEEERIKTNPEETLGKYIKSRMKSPICLLGLSLILIFVVSVLFSQMITGYSFEQAMTPDMGAWDPPSPAHPLGQTHLGGDVFARTMYGIRDSLVFGFGTVLIGLIGGVSLGILAGRFAKWGYKTVMGVMIIVYILPIFLIMILINFFFGYGGWVAGYWLNLIVMGIFLIPIITRAVANSVEGKINIHKIIKQVIIQIPLNVAVAILIYNTVGFLGFGPSGFIQLGNEIMEARMNFIDAPWAFFWPGIAIFELVASFLILHAGLKGFGRKLRKRKVIKNTKPIEERSPELEEL